MHINPDHTSILRIHKPPTFWKFGMRVIVIFHDTNIYINISRFNYRGLKSIFHLWYDYLKIRSISREFDKQTWKKI